MCVCARLHTCFGGGTAGVGEDLCVFVCICVYLCVFVCICVKRYGVGV